MDIFLLYQIGYNIARREVRRMERFVPKKEDKEVTTIRIPKDVLDEIDLKAAEFGISRNQLINQCITYALKNMEQ